MNKLFSLIIIATLLSCQGQNSDKMSEHQHTNRLVDASSPYLLQHAHNPVDWYPWGEEALEKAKKEDKPILVSIGYAACHWCHVMERESFENDSIAAIMNANFICIKVDREERPDVDQVYMEAVQAMGVNGGWPLNVFLTPEQKPFYGGTYFPPNSWVKLLNSIHKAYTEDRDKVESSANQVTGSLNASELEKYGMVMGEKAFKIEQLDTVFQNLANNFDRKFGGMNRSPKFPMPSIWEFLLKYHSSNNNQEALNQVVTTLDRMGQGGIYDPIDGGFARYSVDGIWHVPHFEKMLYDNGQLLSLYANAYAITKNENYAQIIEATANWIKNEMTHENGGFYSSLDADSDGEEGKYYVYSTDEFKKVAGDQYEVFSNFYNIADTGNWEHGNNILLKEQWPDQFASSRNLDPTEFNMQLQKIHVGLKEMRKDRIRPGLDDKILAGWNGLVLKGLVDAYDATGKESYLELALKNANFIEKELIQEERLFRLHKDGKASIPGYLEDYAAVIKGFSALYQATFDEKWLRAADKLLRTAVADFYDEKENLFFFTAQDAEQLIARKKEVFDNVIPSSNSIMAENLYILGVLLDNTEYKQKSESMVATVASLMQQESGYLTNWASVFFMHAQPTVEVVIVGNDYLAQRKLIAENFIPNKVMLGAKDSSTLALMENRYALDGKTTFYICYNKACKLPVFTSNEALNLID